jgi:uncharacterized integral membrane protein
MSTPRPTNKRKPWLLRSPKRLIAIVTGVVCVVFVWLFGLANSEWVPIRLPSWPWADDPSFVVVEVRLWALMVGLLLSGLALAAPTAILSALRHRRACREHERQEGDLKVEIKRLERLLDATQQPRNTGNERGTS